MVQKYPRPTTWDGDRNPVNNGINYRYLNWLAGFLPPTVDVGWWVGLGCWLVVGGCCRGLLTADGSGRKEVFESPKEGLAQCTLQARDDAMLRNK